MKSEEVNEILSRPFNMKNVPQDILEAHNMAIKALEQKSKYRKEAKRWKHKALGQRQVLDKIREEIGTYYADCSLSISENDERCKQCTDTMFCSVLQIIDKHTVESEK